MDFSPDAMGDTKTMSRFNRAPPRVLAFSEAYDVYIPLRKQEVLTRAGYIGLQMRITEQMGRGPSIAGTDIIRALDLISRV